MVLDAYPDWGHSPERFAEFIRVIMGCWKMHAERKGLGESAILGTEMELGEIFLSVFSVDLQPYENFDKLLEQTADKFNLPAVLEGMKMASEADDHFYKLVESGQASQDVESIFEETFMEYVSEDIVQKLSPFIHFHE